MDSRSTEQPPQKELTLKFSGRTEASVRHPEKNEDAIGFPYGEEEKDLNWVAVLDGVGGEAHGDLASRTAIEVISTNLSNLRSDVEIGEVKKKLEETLHEASKTVSEKVPDGSTTAVVAKIVGEGSGKVAVVANVGDSRAYLFRDGRLEQITQDDSVIPREAAAKLDNAVSLKDLTDLEMLWFRKRNLITQALGGAEIPQVHLYRINLRVGDRLVLTSDGVHDNLTTDEIAKLVAQQGENVDNLVEAARKRSSEKHFRAKSDDISAVVVEVT